MNFKVIAGLIGLASLLLFLAPPLVKLKDFALAVVILIGFGMAAYEFYEQLRGKDE